MKWLAELDLTCAVVNRHASLIHGLSNRVAELENNTMNTSVLLREALDEVQSLKIEATEMRTKIAELFTATLW